MRVMPQQNPTEEARARLRRIEGQVRGIQGMLDRMAEEPAARRALQERVRDLLAQKTPVAEVTRILGISRQRVLDIRDGCDRTAGDPCDSLLTQILAVRAAVEQVGLLILELHLRRCVLEGLPTDEEKLRDLRETLKLWSRLTSPAR